MAEDVSQKTPKSGENNKLTKSASRTSSDLFCLCGDSDKSVVQPVPPISSGNNQKKKTSFQITSVTVGSRLSNDGGDDSADDLDESHTDDMSDVVDTSRVTDVENETPSFSEDTFSKEDVFFNSSTSLGSAPVIPTSSQYGLAIVSAPELCNNSNSAVQCGAITNSDLHVTVADNVLNLSVLGAKQHESDMRDIHSHPGRNERFKVVKIESTEPFKRGRWVCMDFLDHSIVQPQAKPNISNKLCENTDNQSVHHVGTDSGISVADSNQTNEDQNNAECVNNSNSIIQNDQISVAATGLNQSVPGQTQNVPGSNPNASGQNHSIPGPAQSAPATHSNASPGQTQQFNPVNCSQPQQHAQSMSQIPVQQTTNFINSNQHQSLQSQQMQQVLANANYQVVSNSNPSNQQQQQQHMNVNNVMQQAMPMQQHVQQQFQQQSMPPPQVVQPIQVHNVSQQQFQQQQQPPQQVQMMQQIPVSQQQTVFVQQPAPNVGSQPSVVPQQPQQIPQQAQQYYTNPTVVHSTNALSNQVPIINSQNQNLTNMMPVHQAQVVSTSQPQQIITQQSQQQPQVMSQPNSMQAQPQQNVPIISQQPNSIPAQPQPMSQTNIMQSQPVMSQQPQSQQLLTQQQNSIQTQPQQIMAQQSNVVQSQPQHMLAQQGAQPNQPQQMMGQQSNSQSGQPSNIISMQSQPQQMMQQQAPMQTQQVISQQTNPVQGQSQQMMAQHQSMPPQMMSQSSNTPAVQTQPILTQTNLQSQPQQMMTQPANPVQPQQLMNQQPSNVQTQPQPVMAPQSMVQNQMMTQQMMAQQPMIPPTNHMTGQPNNFTVNNLAQSNQQGQTQHLSNYSVSQPSSGHHYVPSSNMSQQSYPSSVSSVSVLNEVELSENKMMEQLGVQNTLVESLNDVQNAGNIGDEVQLEDHADSESASGTSAVAIDNKIEQAMDLVKSHLMFAVREEVEVLKEKIAELMERINQLEAENTLLKQNASQETLAQLTAPSQSQPSSNVP